MKKHLKFFRVAETVAETSRYPNIHIGAVIVKKNSIISVGVNAAKSHPQQKRYNALRNINVEIHHNIHAEMNALLKTTEDLTGASVYVFRKDRTGNTANCRPCAACEEALIKRGVRKIHYTNTDGYVYEEWL